MNRRKWIITTMALVAWPFTTITNRFRKEKILKEHELKNQIEWRTYFGGYKDGVRRGKRIKKFGGKSWKMNEQVVTTKSGETLLVSWGTQITSILFTLLLLSPANADWTIITEDKPVQLAGLRRVSNKPLITRRAILGRPFINRASDPRRLGSRRWRSVLLFEKADSKSVKELESCLSFVPSSQLPEMLYMPSCQSSYKERVLRDAPDNLPLVAWDVRNSEGLWRRSFSRPKNYLRDLSIVRRRAQQPRRLILKEVRPSSSYSNTNRSNSYQSSNKGRILLKRGLFTGRACST